MLKLISNPKLSECTSLRLGGSAIAEIQVSAEADVFEISKYCAEYGGKPFILGAGSNILADAGNLPYILIKSLFKAEPVVECEKNDKMYVKVESGVRLHQLLNRCIKWGLSGLEGLCGIPGAIGGAVAMNAGSFGCEIGNCIHSIRIFSPTDGIVDIPAEQLLFSYRKLSIVGINSWYLIIHVIFCLTHSSRNGIKSEISHNFFKKKSTQPLKSWSAGCIFKNPSLEQSAGMLLERAGFKGKKLGGMAFSALHANFLLNEGKGSPTAAFDLIAQAEQAVFTKFGINLKMEVKVLSCQ